MRNSTKLIAAVFYVVSTAWALECNTLFAQNLVADSVLQDASEPNKWDLQSCIEYAFRKNITILKNRLATESSDIDVKSAKATLFPSLSASIGQNIVNRPNSENNTFINGNDITNTQSKTSYNGSYGINARWTLYEGNKRLTSIKQERLNKRISDLNVTESENSIEESITQIYLQILYASETVKVNMGMLDVSKSQQERGKALLDAGSIAQSDYAQLAAQVSTDNYNLVTAQATLQDYRLQLKQMLELTDEKEMDIYMYIIKEESVLAPLPLKADVYRAALSLRPEIEASKIGLQTSDMDITIARAGFIPSLSLTAGIGSTNSNSSDFTFKEQIKGNWNNSIGLSLSIPIYDNRQTKSAIQKARINKQTNQLSLLDEQKTLYKKVETLWLDANSAQQRYIAAAEKLKSTQISYDLISEQFDLGMKNTVELLTEKNNLLQAQQETLQSKYMAILNIQLLKFYKGENISL